MIMILRRRQLGVQWRPISSAKVDNARSRCPASVSGSLVPWWPGTGTEVRRVLAEGSWVAFKSCTEVCHAGLSHDLLFPARQSGGDLAGNPGSQELDDRGDRARIQNPSTEGAQAVKQLWRIHLLPKTSRSRREVDKAKVRQDRLSTPQDILTHHCKTPLGTGSWSLHKRG